MSTTQSIEGFRLSPQQARLWHLQQANGASRYPARCAIRISGDVDKQRLRDALHCVVQRHDILRTTFPSLPGMALPLQTISAGRVKWTEDTDLNGLDTERPDADRRNGGWWHQNQNSTRISDLRATFIRLAEDLHELQLELPALWADARGLQNLAWELGQAYANLSSSHQGLDSPLQYIQVSEWLNEVVESDEAEAGRAFWRARTLESSGALQLPFAKRVADGSQSNSDSVNHFRTQVVPQEVAAESSRRLLSLAEDLGTNPSVILLACWEVLLRRHTGQQDLVVGLVPISPMRLLSDSLYWNCTVKSRMRSCGRSVIAGSRMGRRVMNLGKFPSSPLASKPLKSRSLFKRATLSSSLTDVKPKSTNTN